MPCNAALVLPLRRVTVGYFPLDRGEVVQYKTIFLFLTFVQGGQTLLWQVAKTETEKDLVINSLGRKWELAFTTLVLFGGAMFAAFPKFYSTSFGGAYWVWVLILFTFILQAVSYEYRKKPGNLLGAKVYETFMLVNGSLGILLIGVAIGTFFTGANFMLSSYNFVTWTSSFRGLEAVFSLFNLSVGLFLVFNARTLGAMYLINNINCKGYGELEERLRSAVQKNFLYSLPFLSWFVVQVLPMEGFGLSENGEVIRVTWKYLLNLVQVPELAVALIVGLILVVTGVMVTTRSSAKYGIWSSGLGTVFVGLAVFGMAGFNNTAFYPSKVDLQSSLTIYNASSSLYTLQVMTWVALAIPVVLAYIVYVWWSMDRGKISIKDVRGVDASGSY